jgi:hypothetical protein
MRNQSRPNLAGQSWTIDREDALFWSDWVLAGGWALASTSVSASHSGKTLPMGTVLTTVLALVVGLLAVPVVLRGFAYDATTGKLRDLRPYGLGWVLIANGFGMVLLFASVLAGVRVYG